MYLNFKKAHFQDFVSCSSSRYDRFKALSSLLHFFQICHSKMSWFNWIYFLVPIHYFFYSSFLFLLLWTPCKYHFTQWYLILKLKCIRHNSNPNVFFWLLFFSIYFMCLKSGLPAGSSMTTLKPNRKTNLKSFQNVFLFGITFRFDTT